MSLLSSYIIGTTYLITKIGFWRVLLMLKSRTTTVYYQPPSLAMLENIKVPPLTDAMFI